MNIFMYKKVTVEQCVEIPWRAATEQDVKLTNMESSTTNIPFWYY